MKIDYEGALFFTSFFSSIERNLMKLKVKKAIGKWVGKPYKKDPYLVFCDPFFAASEKRTVVDVGANIGTTVLPLAKRFKKSRFVAIEPHPLPASRFIQNCQLNQISNVSLLSAAIAPKEDLLKIYTCPSNSGGHRVTGFQGRKDIFPQPLNCIEIPSISLRKVFEKCEISYCDLLKIDVEGFEYQVLESLEDFLSPQKIGVVIAEYGPEGMRNAGKTGWEMVNWMMAKGYRCEELSTQKPIQKREDIPEIGDFEVTDFVFSAKK